MKRNWWLFLAVFCLISCGDKGEDETEKPAQEEEKDETSDEESPCKKNQDCGVGEVCGAKGFCIPECRMDIDCKEGYVCAEKGRCMKGSDVCVVGATKPCGSSVGECKQGVKTCVEEGIWSACEGETKSAEEVCDADRRDEDCDGAHNEGCECDEGYEDIVCGVLSVGECRLGRQKCVNESLTECEGVVLPQDEECDGKDNDCDGAVDNGFDFENDSRNCGECGKVCSLPNAKAKCSQSECAIDKCLNGSVDVDTEAENGCECLQTNGGVEICDGRDNDCDGAVDNGDLCSGVFKNALSACLEGACEMTACLPNFYDINQQAVDGCEYFCTLSGAEIPDGKDNDCDGEIDEDLECKPGELKPCGPSDEEAQNGVCKKGWQDCGEDGKWGECLGAVMPSDEVCDGKDNDCDGEIDEGFIYNNLLIGSACDGVGECGAGVVECSVDKKSAVCSTNPDGSKSQAKPEVCDNKDNDCDGQIDEDFKGLLGENCLAPGQCGQGVYECSASGGVQCSTGPGGSQDMSQTEVCDAELKDEDCDGSRNEDCECLRPGDTQPCGPSDEEAQNGICKKGWQVCLSNGVWGVCQNEVMPTTETCNGLDDNCDGSLPVNERDNDGDGVRVCQGDCDDTNPDIKPGAQELCEGVDNDCDGQIDEGFFVGAPCQGVGECGLGMIECEIPGTSTICSTMPGGSGDESSPDGPPDNCDDKDNNCDGSTDEGCECVSGVDERPCGPPEGNEGECRIGVQTCVDGAWANCLGAVYPSVELCDGKDNDCDGQVDEDFSIGAACDGVGECGAGVVECAGLGSTRCSTDFGGSNYDGSSELCDGLDNDCDGAVDEGFFVGAPCVGKGLCGAGTLECKIDGTGTLCSTMPGGSQDMSQPEVCDYADNNCDGQVDEGVKNACGWCGPAPEDGPPNACDGLDNDCDGTIDEGCACDDGDDQDCGTSDVGECRFGIQVCSAGIWGACQGNVEPAAEACDGKDNDCNGFVDNGCGCVHGTVEQCGTTDEGECQYGLRYCNGGAWEACVGNIESSVEVCDGKDNNCDGAIDEGLECAAVFKWTPPTLVTSAFNLYGCYGTRIETDPNNCPDISEPPDGIGDCGVDGLLECLGTWSVFCTVSSTEVFECGLNIPSGYYFEANARREADALWLCHDYPATVEGTASVSRGGSVIDGVPVDNRTGSCNMRWLMP